MLDHGTIALSENPRALLIDLVWNKDVTTRLFVDFQRVNDMSKKDSYPLQRIDECIDFLGGNRSFSTLNLESGYWQIAMEPESKDKTVFMMSLGLFQFQVMAFGLCNVPVTFK